MIADFDPALDLSIERVIKAPVSLVWNAWADPRNLEQWWVPAPARARVTDFALAPGGAFETEIEEGGNGFRPHVRFCFLAVEPQRLIVFTNALTSGFRPAEKPFITAAIRLLPTEAGTHYSAHVMHRSRDDRDTHERLGFYDGWGTVTAQLATFVEAAG